MTSVKLSPAMERALLSVSPCGVIVESTRATEYALIRRGLATESRGKTQRRFSSGWLTVHNGYLGATITEAGQRLASELRARNR